MGEDEPTQGAELEDTDAAGIPDSETQSIHAWSQASDDTEIVESQRRSWKLPVALVTLAAGAAVAVGAVKLWPHHMPATAGHAAPPPAAVAASALPTDPDARFMALYRQRGYKVTDPTQVQALMQNVHTMCGDLSAGRSQESIIREVLNKHPAVSRTEMELLVKTVIDAYHPQPAPPGTSDVDRIFVNSLRDDAHLAAPPATAYAVNYAHEVCAKLGNGASVIDTNDLIQKSTIWETYGGAQKFVLDATFWYCKEYIDAVNATNGGA